MSRIHLEESSGDDTSDTEGGGGNVAGRGGAVGLGRGGGSRAGGGSRSRGRARGLGSRVGAGGRGGGAGGGSRASSRGSRAGGGGGGSGGRVSAGWGSGGVGSRGGSGVARGGGGVRRASGGGSGSGVTVEARGVGAGDGDLFGVVLVTLRVLYLEGDRGSGREVDNPSLLGALDLSKVLEGGTSGLTAWDDRDKVRGRATGPGELGGLALGGQYLRVRQQLTVTSEEGVLILGPSAAAWA